MKKLFFFFLLLIFNSKNVFELKAENPDPGCASEISENYLIKYDYLKIDRIEIETVNYRNWTVNSIKILTSNTRYIDDIYKKRFKAKITVTFEDGSQCVYTGRIRHSGDQKDHISLHDNYILQSVDVHLDNGNIRGITKFKLLRPNTRGVLEDVIIQTQLLRELKYLAPRSIKVKAKINEAESTMLFQEKASKELLEFNNRREGPILEANEKYFWKALKDIPDNQLSNWSAGVVPIHNKSAKIMLTKLTNSNLVTKNNNLKKISLEALSKLNLIYLYYANMFQDGKKNNYNHSDYDLDNNLLGLFEKKNILKLDVYNLLLQATNSNHGLASNNRKFYWNSFDSYFEPINYDANPNINDDLAIGKFRLPISSDYSSSIELLEGKIKNVNIKNFKENLYSSGIDISELDLKRKFNKIIQNLETLKNNYENFVKDEDIAYNQFKNATNMTDEIAALDVLANIDCDQRVQALNEFYERWKSETLVMQKWLSVQANSELPNAYDDVQRLEKIDVYDQTVPNLFRSLMRGFTGNYIHFHHESGRGYKLVADKVIEMDKINPQMAAGLSYAFMEYAKLTDAKKSLMKVELERVINTEGLSKNTYEIISKILK